MASALRSRQRAARLGNTKTKAFALKGGLYLETPNLAIPDGALIDAVNFEVVSLGGYRRLEGYERFDGQNAPSAATYWVLSFDNGSAAISEADVVTGLSSGASGEALIDAVVTSGSYGGGDAAGYLVLTAVTDDFIDDEELQVSAATKALADGSQVENGASTAEDDAAWSQDAIETQRAKIDAVPGSGPVRGIAVYNGDVYAFRDNAGGTAGAMYKATTSGWALQSLGQRVPFDSGTNEFTEGATLSQGGASATILRINVSSGDWSTNDAAGYFIIGTVTGGPFSAGACTGSGGGVASLTGAEESITLPAGGRYDFVVHNFYATVDSRRLYGANGVGEAFEWDGTVFAPIATGNATDTPEHIDEHHEQLFLTFPGGSLQHSGPGLPLDFTAASGAAEIGIGDNITDIQTLTGGTMGVWGRNLTKVLYGTTKDDWELKDLAEEAGGAIEWTVQSIGRPRYLDDRGLTSLAAVQEYGDFQAGVFSQNIERFLEARRDNQKASIKVKNKSQYRLFFSDNTFVIATFNDRKLAGFSTGKYLHQIECTGGGENSIGAEILFFGDDNGFVYQMDSGTSFDGSAIDAILALNYTHVGYPSYSKKFRKITLELEASAETTIRYRARFNYGSSDVPTGLTMEQTAVGSGGYWDISNWDQFTWASDAVSLMEGGLDGEGRNMSVEISSSSTYTESYTLTGMIVHYSMRRLIR